VFSFPVAEIANVIISVKTEGRSLRREDVGFERSSARGLKPKVSEANEGWLWLRKIKSL